MGGFSHGMRQRVKLAQALAHDPELLLLDEPLNGLDPAQRRDVVELLHRLGDEGRTVIVSSHVLHEVERMAPRVLVLVNGHLVAEGETQRDPPADRRPAAQRSVLPPAATAAPLAARAGGRRGRRRGRASRTATLEVETGDVERFSRAAAGAGAAHRDALRRVEPVGDDLESVYAYLHDRARGAGAVIIGPDLPADAAGAAAPAAHARAGAAGARAGAGGVRVRGGAPSERRPRPASSRTWCSSCSSPRSRRSWRS